MLRLNLVCWNVPLVGKGLLASAMEEPYLFLKLILWLPEFLKCWACRVSDICV